MTSPAKLILTTLLMASLLVLTSCSNNAPKSAVPAETTPSLTIVTTLFPQYDFAKRIAGEMADVTLLLPPGVEPHAYEPTPQDIVTIQKSALFIYTSELMEPWALKMAEGIDPEKTMIVDSGRGVEYLAGEHDEDHASESPSSTADTATSADAHEEEAGLDPHIWTDPNNAIKMVGNILEAIKQKDPEHANVYQKNADALISELKALDQEFTNTLSGLKNKEIVYGGHSAFTYFAHRYDLHILTAYEGMSPDSEPTPKKIAELIDFLKEHQVRSIFYEELVNPRVAQVIADETGAKMYLLHGAHNISADELAAETTYLQIMRENLTRLEEGLK